MKRKLLYLILMTLASIFIYNKYVVYKVDKEYGIPKIDFPAEKRKYLNDNEIALAAQYFVEKTLKSPETTKFQPLFQVEIERNAYIYTVNSYVDLQNSFGAIIRSTYKVKFKQNENGEFSLIDLKIE